VGYFLGTYLTVFVLWVMTTAFDYYNEAWSTIEVQDYKGFLRFRFTRDGDVELFSLGIKKTPRAWTQVSMEKTSDAQPGLFLPADMPAMQVEVVDRVLIRAGVLAVDV